MDKWLIGGKRTIITALVILLLIILSFSIVYGFISGSIQTFVSDFLATISPIIMGFIIAYLSNPAINFFESKLFRWIKNLSLRRLISIVLTFSLTILVILVIFTLLIPNLLTTLQSFWDTYIVNYESAMHIFALRLNSILDSFPAFDSMLRIDPNEFVQMIRTNLPWIDNLSEGDFSIIFPDSLLPEGSSGESCLGFDLSKLLDSDNFWSLFGYVLSFSSSIFNFIKNLVLGIFVAIYMLMSKEKIKAYFRRLLSSFLSPHRVRFAFRFANLLDRSFGGFIEGQLLDALIVGVMTYIIFNVFRFTNPLLLATIIATTNIIPVLGPFIGGIPAAFLVLLTQPEKVILFIILIIIVQQIDGNIICPHILGDKINISSLTTLIAIITMGGFFGIVGMLIGVPVFAVSIQLINNYTANALRRKGLEISLDHYYVGDSTRIKAKQNSDKSTKILTAISNFTKKLLRKNNGKVKKEK